MTKNLDPISLKIMIKLKINYFSVCLLIKPEIWANSASQKIPGLISYPYLTVIRNHDFLMKLNPDFGHKI